MLGGTITRCTATDMGGGVYYDGSKTKNMVMSGGSITRCGADSGGGIYLTADRKLEMTGGSITANSATSRGGGIAVQNDKTPIARLYFSGAAYVYGNTSDVSVASNSACNVEMDQSFTVNANNPFTVIVSRGLTRGATIGVYVPGDDNGDTANTTLYDKHGGVLDPFGTFESGTDTDSLHYFVNEGRLEKRPGV